MGFPHKPCSLQLLIFLETQCPNPFEFLELFSPTLGGSAPSFLPPLKAVVACLWSFSVCLFLYLLFHSLASDES